LKRGEGREWKVMRKARKKATLRIEGRAANGWMGV
jgi:hypothetical protein